MDNDFVNWVNGEIKRRGWSGRELGRRSGISQGWLAKILSGDAEPSADFVIKVCEALDQLPESGLRQAGILPSLPAQADGSAEIEVLQLFRNLPLERRKIALTLLRCLYTDNDGD